MTTIFLFNFSHLDSRAVGKKLLKLMHQTYNSALFITGYSLSKILVCFAKLVYLPESSL